MSETSPGVGASSDGGAPSDVGSASSGAEFDAQPGSVGGGAPDPGAGGGEPGASGADPGGDPGAGADPAAAAEIFEFGKRQWPSRERAESEFLTTVGRLQAAQRRISELEADREAWRTQNAGSASGEGGNGAAGAATAEEAAVQALLDPDSLDWDLISGAMKERGPEVGVYLAVKQIAEKLSGNFDGRLKEALKPLDGIQQHTEAASKAAELWDGAVSAVDEGGQLYFPELADPGTLNTVISIWREITDGMPPEVAASPRMARMAVLEFRALNGQASPGGGDPSPAEPAVDPTAAAAGAVAAAQAGAQSRGVLPPGRGRAPGAPRQKPQTEEEAIKASLMSGGQETGHLGFRR